MPSFRQLPPSLRPNVRTKSAQPDAASIHVPVARAMVDCAVYCEGTRLPGKYTHAAALNKVHELEAAGKQAFAWIGLHGPDEHQMQAVADVFGLHPLAVEDAVHAHQRPKLERYDNTLFLVLKTVNYVEHVSVALAREIVETGEIMIFVGPDFVVTVRHGEHGGLAGVRKKFDASPTSLAARALRGHACDRRSRRRQLSRCHRSDRDRHRRHGRGHLLPHSQDQHRVHLPAQARGRRAAPGGRAVDHWGCSESAPTTTT